MLYLTYPLQSHSAVGIILPFLPMRTLWLGDERICPKLYNKWQHQVSNLYHSTQNIAFFHGTALLPSTPLRHCPAPSSSVASQNQGWLLLFRLYCLSQVHWGKSSTCCPVIPALNPGLVYVYMRRASRLYVSGDIINGFLNLLNNLHFPLFPSLSVSITNIFPYSSAFWLPTS